MNMNGDTAEQKVPGNDMEIADDMLEEVSGGSGNTVRFIKGVNICLSCKGKIVWNKELGCYFCSKCKKRAFTKAGSSL